MDQFGGVFKEVVRLFAIDEVAEAHADESHHHAFLVEFVEEVFAVADEDGVHGGVGDAGLHGVGIEVGVADLDGDASGEFVFAAQLEAQFFAHADEDVAQRGDVDGILLKSLFGRDGFVFGIGDDGAVVDAIGFFPDDAAVFAEDLFEEFARHFLERVDAEDTHVAEELVGLIADHGDFFDGQRREEWFFRAGGYFFLAVGFGFAGADLGDGLVGRQGEGDGQVGLADDPASQLGGHLVAAEIAVHAAEVDVEFVDGGLLIEWDILADDLGDDVGVLAVLLVVAADDDGFGAELSCHLHGHGGVYAVTAGLVAAGGHDAAVTRAADQYGSAAELRVDQSLHGDEESVEVDMYDVAIQIQESMVNGQ